MRYRLPGFIHDLPKRQSYLPNKWLRCGAWPNRWVLGFTGRPVCQYSNVPSFGFTLLLHLQLPHRTASNRYSQAASWQRRCNAASARSPASPTGRIAAVSARCLIDHRVAARRHTTAPVPSCEAERWLARCCILHHLADTRRYYGEWPDSCRRRPIQLYQTYPISGGLSQPLAPTGAPVERSIFRSYVASPNSLLSGSLLFFLQDFTPPLRITLFRISSPQFCDSESNLETRKASGAHPPTTMSHPLLLRCRNEEQLAKTPFTRFLAFTRRCAFIEIMLQLPVALAPRKEAQ